MSKEVRISKIVVKMGDREQTLTIAQARELQEALNSLFGGPKEIVKTVPYPVYPKPYWPYREPWITWANDTGVLRNPVPPFRVTSHNGNSFLGLGSTADSYMKLLNQGTVEVKLCDG
jgi:hypothetical protein